MSEYISPYSASQRWLRGNLHGHTSCGRFMDVSESGPMFASLGYDFIAVTDHNKFTDEEQWSIWQEKVNLIVIPGVENGGTDHILEVGIYGVTQSSNGSYAARAEALREAGSFTVGCHPQEYPNGAENIRAGAQYLHAFEIYNGLRESRGNNEGANIVLWDAILTAGGRIWGAAADDFHCAYITPGHGWVSVQIPEEEETITWQMIVEQLKAGAFYASTAPAFKEIFLDDGILRASANRQVRRLRVIGPGGEPVYEVEGSELEWEAVPGLTYFRVEAECGAKRAWSQPFFPVEPGNNSLAINMGNSSLLDEPVSPVHTDCNQLPPAKIYTNSIGMKLVRIEPGRFRMGSSDEPLPEELTKGKTLFPHGDFDERPAHEVKITTPFYISMFQVTNTQYEQFDPTHGEWRGRNGYSNEDDEAVIYVNWHDAVRFCEWLSEKEGIPYRLPTEAEWEYACRAGTTTPFHTGNTLPGEFYNEPKRSFEPTSLEVGQSPPNPWGLCDMHGNVEEWCYDWYGPYEPDFQADPVGREDGDFKVTRGGSHSTWPYYLRSSNRSGSLPEDKQWMMGFRVALGELPKTKPLPKSRPQRYQLGVQQGSRRDLDDGLDSNMPYFRGPKVYVKIPEGSQGPLYARHNHFSAISECPNGDLLAAWFTCMEEMGRELGVAVSRWRHGTGEWEPASIFWDAPDRNDHAHALWHDGDGTLYHFNGLGARWRNLAILMRKSTDNGVTWSKARLIYPEHDTRRNTVVESIFRTHSGEIILPIDGRGGSIIAISNDGGETWIDPDGSIRGTHAGVVQLKDGRLMAFGRHGAIDGKMPMSISTDMGKTWEYSASQFQPISSGQRLVLMRLQEGALFFASFCKDMMITDASGKERPVTGLFGAVSLDEGKTWPHRRLITDDGPGREIETMDGHLITMDAHNSERVGYLSACQSADGIINLLSSRQHYEFNLAWLMALPPSALITPSKPDARQLPVKCVLSDIYRPKELPSQDNWRWNFNGRGLEESEVVSFLDDCSFKIHTDVGGQFWWRSDEVFGAVDAQKGFTAEIRLQVLKSTPNNRGIDLEIYDAAGSRYAITITGTGVYWYEGTVLGSAFLPFEQFIPIAEGLDNTDEMHTYRLAIREDRVVHIYRDVELIGLRRYEYRTPRDAYILFGAGGGVEALVDYVAYDLNGPNQSYPQ